MKFCICAYCGEGFKARRTTAQYCSPNCRTLAWRRRKKNAQAIKINSFSQEELKDLNDLFTYHSPRAARFVQQVAAIVGKPLAVQTMDAMYDLLSDTGVLDTLKLPA